MCMRVYYAFICINAAHCTQFKIILSATHVSMREYLCINLHNSRLMCGAALSVRSLRGTCMYVHQGVHTCGPRELCRTKTHEGCAACSRGYMSLCMFAVHAHVPSSEKEGLYVRRRVRFRVRGTCTHSCTYERAKVFFCVFAPGRVHTS